MPGVVLAGAADRYWPPELFSKRDLFEVDAGVCREVLGTGGSVEKGSGRSMESRFDAELEGAEVETGACGPPLWIKRIHERSHQCLKLER